MRNSPCVQASATDASVRPVAMTQFMADLSAIGVTVGLAVHDDVEYILPPGVTREQIQEIRDRHFPREAAP